MDNDYFSDSYSEARAKFLQATAHLSVESVCIRDDLYIDFAMKNSRSKNKILFLVSGTHGVEGYIGSAVQLLFIKEFLPQLDDVAVCLIHSLDPFGFKYNRRVNENNVDLNRNSVYDERLMLGIPNTSLSNIVSDSLLFLKFNKPRKHRMVEALKYYQLVFRSILKSGIKNTIKIGLGGQSSYPKSVGFKGVKLEDSLLHLRSYIEDKTKGFNEAFFIDIHSGINKKYVLSGFTNEPSNSKEFSRIKQYLNNLKSRNKFKATNHKGSVSDLFLARSHATINYDLTLEYGTIPKLSSRLILDHLAKLNIAENQIFYFGTDSARYRMMKKFKKAYSPCDKTFKISTLRKTRMFFRNLVDKN